MNDSEYAKRRRQIIFESRLKEAIAALGGGADSEKVQHPDGTVKVVYVYPRELSEMRPPDRLRNPSETVGGAYIAEMTLFRDFDNDIQICVAYDKEKDICHWAKK